MDRFLETLNGKTHRQSYKLITLQCNELKYKASHPKSNSGETVVFRTFKSEIEFLNKLGFEVGYGWVSASTILDRSRIDKVLENLSLLDGDEYDEFRM